MQSRKTQILSYVFYANISVAVIVTFHVLSFCILLCQLSGSVCIIVNQMSCIHPFVNLCL